jgi:hypothetical protein
MTIDDRLTKLERAAGVSVDPGEPVNIFLADNGRDPNPGGRVVVQYRRSDVPQAEAARDAFFAARRPEGQRVVFFLATDED